MSPLITSFFQNNFKYDLYVAKIFIYLYIVAFYTSVIKILVIKVYTFFFN